MSITVCSSVQELPEGCYLADCAVSGGTLRQYLCALLQTSPGPLCVQIRPEARQFCLPCPDGQGRLLSQEALARWRKDAPCYISKALCAAYVTALADAAAHVVLFDTLETLRRKLQTAEECGVPYALIQDAALRQKL